MTIITIAILAVLSGADGFVAIETYGKTQILHQEKLIGEWIAEVFESTEIAASSL